MLDVLFLFVVPGSPRPPGEAADARTKKADDEADDDDGGSNSSGSTTLSATSTCDNNNFSADEANAASGGLQVSCPHSKLVANGSQ